MQTFYPFYRNYFCHVSTIYVSKKPKCRTVWNWESSLQGGYADFKTIFTYLNWNQHVWSPRYGYYPIADLLFMLCTILLPVYDEANKGMLIIALLVQSENVDIVLLHKCTMLIAAVHIAFMGSYALLEVTLLSVNCIVVCYCIPFSFFRVVSLLLHIAGANCLTNLPTLLSLSWIGWEQNGQHHIYLLQYVASGCVT